MSSAVNTDASGDDGSTTETWILAENTRTLLAMIVMSGGEQIPPGGWQQIDEAARQVTAPSGELFRIGFTAGTMRVRLSRTRGQVVVELTGDPETVEQLAVICGVMQRQTIWLGGDPHNPVEPAPAGPEAS